MKIAIVSNLYEPFARGGAEVIVKRTAVELSRQGNDVVIITTHPWREERSFTPVISTEGEIKVIRYAVPNIFFYTKDGKHSVLVRGIWHILDLFNLFSARTCKKILQSEKPDLVISHNLIGMSYFIPGVIRSLSIKHIHVLHDIQLAVRSGLMKKGQEHSWFADGVLAKVYQSFVRILFASPDLVVSPSNFLKRFYQERGYFKRSKFNVVRNPVSPAFLSYQPINNEQSKKITFGYVGQLEKHNGVDILQQVFNKNELMDVNLEVVGSGSLSRQVELWSGKKSNINYKGKIPNEDLPSWYASIDCLVLPTMTYENSPTVVYEALASGLPVIVSDIGGAAEMVAGTAFGAIVEPGYPESLYEAVISVKKHIQQDDYDSKKIKASVEKLNVKNYCQKILSI